MGRNHVHMTPLSEEAFLAHDIGDVRHAEVHLLVDLRVADAYAGGGKVLRADANTVLVPYVPTCAVLDVLLTLKRSVLCSRQGNHRETMSRLGPISR